MKLNFRLLTLMTMLVFAGCKEVTQSPFQKRSSATSGDLAPSRWDKSKFPLQIKISEDFSADEEQAIVDMANAWSDSIEQKAQFMDSAYFTQEKGSDDLRAYEDDTIGVYKLRSWPYELPLTALAVTQIVGVRKNIGRSSEYIEIQHADILINYEIFGFTTDNTWGYDLQTVVLHEMGHLLGLYHDESSIDESVMYPSIVREVSNRFPKEKDIGNIEAKYGVYRSDSVNPAISRAIAGQDQQRPEEAPGSDEEQVVVIQFELMADGCKNHKKL